MSIGIIIAVLIVAGLGLYLVKFLPIDGTFQSIIRAVVIVAVVLYMLNGFGLFSTGPVINLGGRHR